MRFFNVFFLSKIQNTSEHMAQGKLELKFERNSHIRHTYISGQTTDGRTDDGRISIS